nr:phytanoyl-CoA hydroxylase-interacting protein-like [Crassostrea virginica]
MKENSCVETFSVDVNHIPPSTYTVTGLGPPGSDNDVGPPTGLPQGAALHGETSVIEEKLRKLVLSSNSETSDKQTRASYLNNPEKIHKNQPSFVTLIFLKDTETRAIFPFFATNSEATFPFQLRPVTDYELVVFRGWETQKLCYRVHAVAHCSFKSYMTQTEVYELYKRALRHTLCPGFLPCYDFIPVTYLYRNKPLLHFLNICNNTNGIMFKYIKNFGGDPASTLNRKLHGLFFSANVDPTTGLPPPVSYYGDQRIHIPVSLMITPFTNLYFADFYCHYVNHKVTLVVTRKGSEADNFCRSRLLPLNQSFNEFLYLSPGSHVAMVNTRVTVEVFYTESIDIMNLLKSKYAYMTTVKQSGNPLLKTIVGIPKRKDCQICNIK